MCLTLFAFLLADEMLWPTRIAMIETWRLLIDDFADGATNMARDEALAAAHASGATPPTLRLYRWRPACLSLGRFQRSAAIDRAACARERVEIVRRPSGGRALLHADELTYAVIARADHPLIAGGSVVDSYRLISAALLAGLRRLGVTAELTPARRGDKRPTTNDQRPTISKLVSRWSAACFDAPSSYELTVDGRKLAGSAQTRRDGVLLQHGAIPLTPHAGRLAALLADPPDDLDQKMIALDQALGRASSFDELAEALLVGFAVTWDVDFEHGQLTIAEQQHEEQLRITKYAEGSWTFAR
jgi:lipoyl(octanoyl) transferase